ncbi:Uncharacterised protein [Mycobacteroides abscessus subsp. massiliense]|nr:Uncharacterised protein [Mycobacteroides abscessus subsp. massiliense]SKL92944.1 Uncharacterised protein [Mycobacteroides abscessus subsp. massiliense]SKM76258.1 Uncharacterised protein [Mycobacteroides abscessus subsp. massiliense]
MSNAKKSAINWAQVVPMRSIIRGLPEDRSPVYLDLNTARNNSPAEGVSLSVGTKCAVNTGTGKR